MTTRSMATRRCGRCAAAFPRLVLLLLGSWLVAPAALAHQEPPDDQATAPGVAVPPKVEWEWDRTDPRIGLRGGWLDAEEAIRNLELVASRSKPRGFFDSAGPDVGRFTNSDLAFRGNFVFVGNYHGWQAYDISDPSNPRLRVAVVCPGGQGDVSVYRNLLFMSSQETRARLDCGTEGVPDTVSTERIRGIRIFDISDIDHPRQVAAVQTCRGSHTHSLATDPRDDAHVYVYISGISAPRPAAELEGCSALGPDEDPNTSYWRIEVIRVPLASPHEARIVSAPRVFADPVTGDIAGLWAGGDHGPGTQRTWRTSQCHDITTYPAIGLAGGACAGNGMLLDITDPVNPRRINEVTDPNFAYWHSATFNNDGTKVVFTDEWGGGRAPRCRETDPPTWGGNAIFDIVEGELRLRGYYKLPVPQTEQENCVAHNGSLIPVPGRDIMVQAWYQGGVSIFDFTDPANPFEIAFFDRGPIDETRLVAGGHWSAYWYNGNIYAAEIARGLDVLRLTPSEHLSQNEIDAALLTRTGEFNAQHQPRITWPPGFVVPRAYLDQLTRAGAIDAELAARVTSELTEAERRRPRRQRQAILDRLDMTAAQLEAKALAALAAGRAGHSTRVLALLAASIRDLTRSLRRAPAYGAFERGGQDRVIGS